ncbi:MAG: HAMP domain-containing histidine kinase [Phycisphaerae bacterium]|nr:HAMP domain-containing histidine kinase [Phycisphaerae bacterium]
MRPISLKTRVVLLVLAVLTVVVVTVDMVAYRELGEALMKDLDLTLSAVRQAIQADLQDPFSPGAQADLRSVLGGTSPRSAFLFCLWREDGGQVLLASDTGRQAVEAWVKYLATRPAPPMHQERFLNLQAGTHPYRVLWTRQPTPQGVVAMLIATSSHSAYHERDEFLRMLVILSLCTFLAAGVLTVVSVLWAMRPLRQTAKRLEGVTHRNLGAEHLAGIHPPGELVPFVEAVKNMLERLNQTMQSQKRFIADASHELRTPLAVAKSTIQTARLKQRSDQEYRQTLDELLKDVDRLDRLTGQLLDLARLEESEKPATMADVPLAGLLNDLAERYDAQAARDGGKVAFDPGQTAATVRGNPAELARLFGNLIDNAVKHGPRGRTVHVALAADGPARCRITVHDEGGQIPAEQVARLFDRFYRADGSRSRMTGGSGLGLAIAQEIASRHGGHIQITSSSAEGTTVSVLLPSVS